MTQVTQPPPEESVLPELAVAGATAMTAAQFARLQAAPIRGLQKTIRAVLHLQGVPLSENQVDEVTGLLYRPVLKARQDNYAAALRYVRSQPLPPALQVPLLRDYPRDALHNTIADVSDKLRVEDEPITAANRTDTRVVELTRKVIEGPVTRQALEPARETIAGMGEDEEDGLHVGWARVLVGARSCGFCAMLASRGPVYTSRESAIGRGGNPLDAYHSPYLNKNGKMVGGLCDCIAVLVTSFTRWEGRKAWEGLEDLWNDSGGKTSGKDARNAFRRVWDKKVRDGESGEFLVKSLQPRPRAA